MSALETRFPLVGRDAELAALTDALDAVAGGSGQTYIVPGEGGVGKTRLTQAVAELAGKKDWMVAVGRAYPVESGMPYALFSDAFAPIIRKFDSSALQTLTRGGSAELIHLFPALAAPGERSTLRGEAGELKPRLLWNFAQFLSRLAAKQPILVILENLQWADASSIELLHFVARQVSKDRILILCTYNEAERYHNPHLLPLEQSLVSLSAVTVMPLQPLTLTGVDELVRRIFGVEHSVAREFTALLYGWTRGNAFFVEETLKSLVESGKLYERDGTWLGWELGTLELPRSLRDVVIGRSAALSTEARALADLGAVLGTIMSYDVLRAVSGMGDPDLLRAIDELKNHRVIEELGEAPDGSARYDFMHPLVRDALYTDLGKARARLLHGTVAEALERYRGSQALGHAGELAFHFARADGSQVAGKAITYLAAAGRDALRLHANREAASYLTAALQHLDAMKQRGDGSPPESRRIVEDLARARQRLGEYDAARVLWERALAEARAVGDHEGAAAMERRLGLAAFWSGRYDDALSHYDSGLAAADQARASTLRARIQLARAMCLQELGRAEEASREVAGALELAESSRDTAVLARAHRASMLLHLFSGPPERAREHGRKAMELAGESGQKIVEWSAQWGLSILEGLTGHSAQAQEHLAKAEKLADELRSPLLRLWNAEVGIEYATGTGDWDAALALAERSITLARALGQRTLLPRLLVWAALVYSLRGDDERARQYLDEAWQVSGAGRTDGAVDVHAVVPVHMGRAAYHLARREYEQAIAIGEAGLAIADRTGYVAWAIHRLLPIIGEAALWTRDWARVERHTDRVRREAGRLGHQLGLAWADASEATAKFVRDNDPQRAIPMLRSAAERLEAIPFIEYGARIRRILARALAAGGDRDGALRELRVVHDTLARLGAERELGITRDLMRDFGARPPSRSVAEGTDTLTGREVEIVRLVAQRRSNKEIGTALQISPRTVSTHLSNIFGKLGVESRGELTDLVRRGGIPGA
jgi:ATP/maltotriose-dependent transcriptional regulator MalT